MFAGICLCIVALVQLSHPAPLSRRTLSLSAFLIVDRHCAVLLFSFTFIPFVSHG
jgi:hypothetical protein